MKIAIIGVGYVGLVVGTCLSSFGHQVVCVDKNQDKVNSLIKGEIPIYEPSLNSLIKKNVLAGNLKFEKDIDKIIKEIDVLFIAIDTPTEIGESNVDLSSLISIITKITSNIENEKLIVIKSTVPVGTNKKLSEIIQSKTNVKCPIVSNPEFLREGSAIEDFMRPDRVIIGTNDEKAKKIMAEIYKPLYLRDYPIIFTDPDSAEMIKYASNVFLATKVSFINEVAGLCEKTGANIKEVAKGMGLDKRIGNKFLHAGPGYGGSCFPKDTIAFVNAGRNYMSPQTIVEAVIKVNEHVKQRMVDKILALLGGIAENKVITIFGVTFKPNTDDMREAPSLSIIPKINRENNEIRIVDPEGKIRVKKLLPYVLGFDDPYEAVSGADILIILTEWNQFRALDLKKIATAMRTPFLADLRNIYSKSQAIEAGFKNYCSVGRVE